MSALGRAWQSRVWFCLQKCTVLVLVYSLYHLACEEVISPSATWPESIVTAASLHEEIKHEPLVRCNESTPQETNARFCWQRLWQGTWERASRFVATRRAGTSASTMESAGSGSTSSFRQVPPASTLNFETAETPSELKKERGGLWNANVTVWPCHKGERTDFKPDFGNWDWHFLKALVYLANFFLK